MICGGALDRSLLEITEPDRFEKHCGVSETHYIRRWMECQSCGAANDVLPVNSRQALGKLRSSYYEVDLSGGDVNAKYRMVMGLPPERSDNWQRVLRVHSFLEKWQGSPRGPLRVMDIGAGTGVFLSRLMEYGESPWEAIAVEPDPVAARHLRSLGKFSVCEELFTGQPTLSNYRLITLNKVLEHIEHPVDVLKLVGRALTPDGIVYVEVPDKLTIKLRPPTDNILGALHFHLYHPRSLAGLLESADLEPLQIERIFEPSGKISVYGFACLPEALSKR